MNVPPLLDSDHLPRFPVRRDWGIGVVGAGFIVRDCHLVAYAEAGFRTVGLTSRTRDTAEDVAALRAVPRVFDSLETMLDCPEVEIVDVAVPPAAQPAILRRIAGHARKVKGVLAQKPLAMSLDEAKEVVAAFRAARVPLQVNQNMRYDHSVRALKALLARSPGYFVSLRPSFSRLVTEPT